MPVARKERAPVSARHPGAGNGSAYSGDMGFVIVLLVVVAAFAAYRFRHKIAAKVLGQSEERMRRHLK